MKILSIQKEPTGKMVVWIQDGRQYKKVFVSVDDQVEEDVALPTSKYKNYEHFVGVMSKFNPYTIFRKQPPTVAKLDFEELTAMRHEWEKEAREFNKELGAE